MQDRQNDGPNGIKILRTKNAGLEIDRPNGRFLGTFVESKLIAVNAF